MTMSKKVALMCGHGTMTNGVWDPGTTYNGYTEAKLMLPITKAAVKYLRQQGIKVISDADTNNNKNMVVDVAWANKQKVDCYVSVHCDWYKAATGVYPLYVSSGGKKLATALNKAIKSDMSMKSRGVCKRTDLYELNQTDAVACVLETGSIKADLKILKNKSDKYGKAIAKGICNYLGVTFSEDAKAETTQPAETTLYRVRKTWADADSQVGAYMSFSNAKEICDKHAGYSVFNENGKAVYTSKAKTSKINYAVKLKKKAKALVWSAGTKKSKYAWKGGSATEAFEKALARVFTKKERSKWGKAAAVGCSCDVFVATCVRDAGIDDNYPRGLREQYTYKPKNMRRLVFKNVRPIDVSQNRDILVYAKNAKKTRGHTLIRGKKVCYEAQHEMTYGHINGSISKLKTKRPYVVVFRPKR